MRLTIAGQDIELEPNTVIGVSKTADRVELSEPINSSYTSEFAIPMNRNNTAILGNIQALDVTGNEYSATDCILYDNNDVPMTVAGLLLINRIEGDSIICNVIEGAVNFLDQLGDTTLQMLGIGSIGTPVERTEANIVSNILNDYTDGFSYATADFGDEPATTYDIDYMYPFSYMYSILQAMTALTTYTLDATVGLMTDSTFRQTPLAYSGDRYNIDGQFVGFYAGTLLADAGVYTALPQQSLIQNANFDDFGFKVKDSRLALFFEAFATIRITTIAGAYEYNVRIRNTTQNIIYGSYSSGLVTGAGVDPIVEFTIRTGLTQNYADGDVITIEFNPEYAIDFDIDCHWRSDDGRDYDSGASPLDLYTDPPAGFPLDPLTLMPDMLCTDFLKGVLNMFLARIDIDNVSQIFSLKKFEVYGTDTASAEDWSDKVDTLRPVEIEYAYGDYKKVNTLGYDRDDDVASDLGNGTISITNVNVAGDKQFEIFKLPFAPSGNRGDNMLVPILTGIPFVITETVTPRPCLLTATAGSITVGATPVANYNISSFGNLSFQRTTGSLTPSETGLLAVYYPQYILMLQQMQRVKLYVKLDAQDWEELDFFKLKYINYTTNTVSIAGYYLLQLIDEYTGEGTVQVELVNVNIE